MIDPDHSQHLILHSRTNVAPAGNRTRVCTVAGYYSTTRPLVLVECFVIIYLNKFNSINLNPKKIFLFYIFSIKVNLYIRLIKYIFLFYCLFILLLILFNQILFDLIPLTRHFVTYLKTLCRMINHVKVE